MAEKKQSSKFCGVCGESITSYKVIDNAPTCKNCQEEIKEKKK